jgi:anthranilate synthase component 1
VAPDRDRFVALAAEHRVVPVWREVVADTMTPVATFLRLVGERPGFLLESVEGGERWGRYSFVGREPIGRVVAFGDHLVATGAAALDDEAAVTARPGVLAHLERLLATYRSPELPGLPPLHGGIVGYLGYDIVREVEHLPDAPEDDRHLPDAVLGVIGQLCVFDHWRQRVVLVDNVVLPPEASADQAVAAHEAAARRLDAMAAEMGRATEGPPLVLGRPGPRPSVSARLGASAFRDAVGVAKELIAAGEIFQVVLSRRFDFTLDVDPFTVYRVLRLVNPSPYLYFLRDPLVTVVGASPEPMVRVRDGVVTSRPIAGSRPRGTDAAADAALAGELAEDPKERAEHVMLVDLARNDVGRVAEHGSVTVDELMVVERYSHVMHLTSQVSGRLRGDLGPVAVLRATLPAGTLSGAPKVRAMQIIDDLEPTRRGVYGGVVGYVDFSGTVDTAIAIRTMVVAPDGRASVQAGAGIVADSDPAREQAEVDAKAAAILEAVAAARSVGTVGGPDASTAGIATDRSGSVGPTADGPAAVRASADGPVVDRASADRAASVEGVGTAITPGQTTSDPRGAR